VTLYQNKVGVTGGGGRGSDLKKKAIEEKQEKEKYGNAMILPCPLKQGQKVELLDLSKDNFKFDRIDSHFPHAPIEMKKRDKAKSKTSSAQPHLEVHEVGEYFVSIAENLGDLQRIDPAVFKVSSNIEELFTKHYASGFGFIICAFNPEAKIEGGHPIGYVHDLLPDGRLFVPCRHEHGHGTKEKEHFDHFIYSINTAKGESGDTAAEMLALHPGWDASKVTAESALKSDKLQPLYPKIEVLRRRRIGGAFANEDLIFARA